MSVQEERAEELRDLLTDAKRLFVRVEGLCGWPHEEALNIALEASIDSYNAELRGIEEGLGVEAWDEEYAVQMEGRYTR